MQAKYRAIVLVIIATLLAAVAQILFKFASGKLSMSIVALLTNVELILGFVFYALVAFLFISALKDGELTVLYPILATNYIWVAIASPFFFPTDSLTPLKIMGIITIIAGVYCIGRGMKHKVEVI